MHKSAIAALIMSALLPAGSLAQTPAQATAPAPGDKNILAWAAKPAALMPYTPPNRLVYRLADILAAHKGKQSWAQSVVLTRDFIGQWISMAPGEKTKTVFYADDRVFWEIQSGQMRVTIQGQDPFVASKGFLVQVPKRLTYSMETVGDTPVLRFEVRPAGEPPQYPISEKPTPMPGVQYVQAVFTGHGDYDKVNRPFIDFQKQIVQGGEKIGVWVRDDHTYVTILRSEKGLPTPPDTEWGHFHENFPEFWLIVEGTQQFLVEGEKLVTVQDGDLVATPMGRWHRAEPYGDGPSTRLAFIPRPDNLHWYQPGQAGE
jgi:mannose-6-phosphate isomerase-like protein (cupin superfamily)